MNLELIIIIQYQTQMENKTEIPSTEFETELNQAIKLIEDAIASSSTYKSFRKVNSYIQSHSYIQEMVMQSWYSLKISLQIL